MRTDPTKQAFDALAARVAALEAYNVVTDYGNGWYGKPEPGGKVHIWKSFTASSISMAAWGNMYEGPIFRGVSYPFAFSSVPEFWVTVNDIPGYAAILAEYTGGSTTATPSYYAIRPNNSTPTVKGVIHAVGVPA